MAARSTNTSSSLWDTLSNWTNNIGNFALRSQAQRLDAQKAITQQTQAAADKANARATQIQLAKINANAAFASRQNPALAQVRSGNGGVYMASPARGGGFSLPSWAAPAGLLLVGVGLFMHFKKA